jgi:hypothetical protein
MLITLVVALSLAAPAAAIDVPFLPQTEALCGGAATAMVFRYWGDAHADVQEFAPLVDRRAGGIANDVLADAVRGRGWQVGRTDRSLDALTAHLVDGHPVIVLIPDRGTRYHYVVVTGATEAAIIVHDPAWGPSRSIARTAFERSWRAADYWSMVVLPPAGGIPAARAEKAPAVEAAVAPTACDRKLDEALTEIRERGLDAADAVLDRVRAACPGSAGPVRELSGVRFAQRRWPDAAALARQALTMAPGDAYALDVLGSSLFMQNDSVGALRAWNQIGRPRVNLVRIEGVRRTRHQAIVEALGIQPNMFLEADVFERARRRLDELPDHSTARLAVRPESDGFADVDVVIAERDALPRGFVEWAGAVVRAGVNREVAVAVPGPSGQGEMWSAGWSWWRRRPGVSVGFAAPRLGGLPGIWRVAGSWQEETFVDGAGAPFLREARTRATLAVSDWLSGGLRYEVSAGLDAWNRAGKAAATGASIERRALGDRVSIQAGATRWTSVTSGPSFHSTDARLIGQSSTQLQGWVYQGDFGIARVSDAAPYALWPGAGDGHAREQLLRAHPLLRDGVINLGGSSAFGRTLVHASVEAQRWLERPALVRVGFAGFIDAARASRRAVSGGEVVQVDVGGGMRVKVPGARGVLRIDAAHGARDGANALTVGWLFSPLAK